VLLGCFVVFAILQTADEDARAIAKRKDAHGGFFKYPIALPSRGLPE
jgi:hypothetical protein